MKRIFLLILLFGSLAKSSAQKLEGVYVGEIITPSNILIVKIKGTDVTGSVYLNKTDKLDFLGTYVDHLLKGSVQLANGGKVLLEGKLGNNPTKLVLSLNDTDKKRVRSLFKVSASLKYKIADLFSDQYDLILLGRWETFKGLTNIGEVMDGKSFWEFEPDGNCTTHVVIPSKKTLNIPTPPGFNASQIPKTHQQGWETKEGILTITHSTRIGPIKNVFSYSIKGDTLFLNRVDGPGLRYFIRK